MSGREGSAVAPNGKVLESKQKLSCRLCIAEVISILSISATVVRSEFVFISMQVFYVNQEKNLKVNFCIEKVKHP